MNLQFLLLCLFTCLPNIHTYKVLVFNPAFGASHSNFLGKISDILIDAGNEITMFIPVFMAGKKNLVGSKKVQRIIRMEQDPRIFEMHKGGGTEEMMRKKIWKMNADMTSMLSFFANFTTAGGYMCESIFKDTELIESLRAEKYDLAISESLFMCGFALFDHIGIKTVINADSILYMDPVKYSLGEPAATSYYPGFFSTIPDKMTFLQRTRNTIGMLMIRYFSLMRIGGELETIKSYYKNNKSWDQLISSVAFNMINSNQYLDYASPVLPKTVFVGGMQVQTRENSKVELSKEWNAVLNERKMNVLVSFGSNAYSSEMPDDIKQAFLKVFESMPNVTFIWKYEVDDENLAKHLPNVVLTKWMPQNDLLADKRLSLFVTHGGLGSTVELAYQGTPAVVIPLMGDQPRNAHMLTRHGGAFLLDKSNLNNPEALRNAIQTVINDPTFSANAKKLSSILKSQPNQPKEVVLKHCDFAVKFGSIETLNSAGRHLNVLQYYCVDIAFVAVLILYIVYRLVKLIACGVSRVCKSRLTVKTKSKLE